LYPTKVYPQVTTVDMTATLHLLLYPTKVYPQVTTEGIDMTTTE